MNDTQENRSLSISIYAYIMNATTTNTTQELSQKEKKKAYNKAYREANKQYISDLERSYRKANKEATAARRRAWHYKQVETNSLYKAKKKLRRSINSTFDRIKKNKPTDTQTLLGCSWEEAKAHFESLFQEGMSWENHGKWHIDHIRPVSSFTEKDMHLMNHISNLQPLWANDNLQKSDNYL